MTSTIFATLDHLVKGLHISPLQLNNMYSGHYIFTLNRFREMLKAAAATINISHSDVDLYLLSHIKEHYLPHINNKIKEIEAIPLIEQKTPEWFKQRETMISASDAGYFLKKCGFEGVGKMFISNNANNIISNAYQTGILQNKKSVATISPAIDIAIPSNFERMLFLESGLNSSKIAEIYMQIKSGSAELSTQIWQNFKNYFDAKSITDGETLSAIKKCYDDFGYILDPHAAVAYAHFGHSGVKNGIIMATAHPCKFEDAVFDAIGIKEKIPESNKNILEKSEKLEFSTQENAKDVILGFFG